MIAFIAIVCLTGLCYTKGIDVSIAISGICVGLAGSNAFEKGNKNKAQFNLLYIV